MARLGELVLVPVIEIPDPELVTPLADALIEGGCRVPRSPSAPRQPQRPGDDRAASSPRCWWGQGRCSAWIRWTGRSTPARSSWSVRVSTRASWTTQWARGPSILPGICTPSEIEMARLSGLEIVKFFPAEAAGGAKYIRALTAPYRSHPVCPHRRHRRHQSRGIPFHTAGDGGWGELDGAREADPASGSSPR